MLSYGNQMRDINNILKTYWGYDSFRGMQQEIIQSVLEKKDTLALLPTGGGKSICFQVPALASEGLCLVVSPLIALMKDQVENLRRRNITAFAIYAGMSRKEVINTLEVAAHSNCKFLYVSPERLETNLFKEYLPALPVNLLAIDEAHCISQWGYDFRPAYLRILALRDEIPNIPILALTASATLRVQEDICKQLAFKNHQVFRQSFERPNLSYSVFQSDSRINKILEVLQNVKGSSIVYCRSRKRTKEVADLLNLQKISAGYYHAGLDKDERNKIQEQWLHNKIDTIVCTNAFGMGIDKPDVRCVIHADVPDCLENYYQEAGRAGRDGHKAFAVLLYGDKELTDLKDLADVRYPGVEELKRVYEAVMNYLQIAGGTGEGLSFNFDLLDFVKRFKLDAKLAAHALQSLSQQELFVFSEQVFIPSIIQFTCTKETLYDFTQSHPELDLFIKTILRTYEGIFENPVAIHEKTIGYLLRIELTTVVEACKKLHAFGIVNYSGQKDRPQLSLLKNRVKINELILDIKSHNERKLLFVERVRSFLEYVHDRTTCRSRIIGLYFGDPTINPCGKCDNCLNKKKLPLTPKEFEEIHQDILNHIGMGSLLPQELFRRLGNVKKEKAWEVIHFLESENKIGVDSHGAIMRKM